MLANTAASLPLKRVGEPADMGAAIHYPAAAPFVTGVVLDDGGRLRASVCGRGDGSR